MTQTSSTEPSHEPLHLYFINLGASFLASERVRGNIGEAFIAAFQQQALASAQIEVTSNRAKLASTGSLAPHRVAEAGLPHAFLRKPFEIDFGAD